LAGGAEDGAIYVFNTETDQLAHTLSGKRKKKGNNKE
jgi:WD repeat-containing protein 61